MSLVYFDCNATTPVAREVAEALVPFLTEHYGNASSIHAQGQRARAAVEIARRQVAGLIGARSKEIVFTSGGTEADNLAIFGLVGASTQSRRHVISAPTEHSAVLAACRRLEREGTAVTYVKVDGDGRLDPEDVRRAITPDTVLITVMHANNETGVIQPVAKIAAIAREHDIPFHTDAVQSAGKIPVNVEELGADLLSLSAHKIYGPKGVGALWIRAGLPLRPLIVGGKDEKARRPGTANVPGIVGFGAAAELVGRNLEEEMGRVAALRDRFEQGVLKAIPQTRVNGQGARRTPNTSNIVFEHVEGEALVIALDLKGVACSTGAACSSGAIEPSHVLTAMGLPVEQARGSLRFSLGRDVSEKDVDYVLEVLPGVVNHLRELSPSYNKEETPAAD